MWPSNPAAAASSSPTTAGDQQPDADSGHHPPIAVDPVFIDRHSRSPSSCSIGAHDVPYTTTATRLATTVDESHITNIGSENECQMAYFEMWVVPVSSVAIEVTWEPLAGKK